MKDFQAKIVPLIPRCLGLSGWVVVCVGGGRFETLKKSPKQNRCYNYNMCCCKTLLFAKNKARNISKKVYEMKYSAFLTRSLFIIYYSICHWNYEFIIVNNLIMGVGDHFFVLFFMFYNHDLQCIIYFFK